MKLFSCLSYCCFMAHGSRAEGGRGGLKVVPKCFFLRTVPCFAVCDPYERSSFVFAVAVATQTDAAACYRGWGSSRFAFVGLAGCGSCVCDAASYASSRGEDAVWGALPHPLCVNGMLVEHKKTS